MSLTRLNMFPLGLSIFSNSASLMTGTLSPQWITVYSGDYLRLATVIWLEFDLNSKRVGLTVITLRSGIKTGNQCQSTSLSHVICTLSFELYSDKRNSFNDQALKKAVGTKRPDNLRPVVTKPDDNDRRVRAMQ